jgi:hypothetical protein
LTEHYNQHNQHNNTTSTTTFKKGWEQSTLPSDEYSCPLVVLRIENKEQELLRQLMVGCASIQSQQQQILETGDVLLE